MKQKEIDEKKVTAIIRDIPKGIIGWYDFSGVKSALFIGDSGEPVYEELCEKIGNERCLVADNESALNSVIGGETVFDLIVCSTAFEKIKDATELFSILRKCLGDNGRMLIAMNNRLGIKYFCGDRDPYTERNFDGIEDYRRAYTNQADTFNGRCYSQDEIKEILANSGFGAYSTKFYSIYPSIEEPTFLYEEGYIPNEDLSNRIKPSYNYPQSVFLDEDFLYNDLVKNGLFHKMANGYLVEVVPRGANSDVAHVTNSIERGREDALYTIITKDKVCKRAVYSEGNARLENLDKNIRALASRNANVVDGALVERICNGQRICEYSMPFINAQTTQKYLKALAEKGDKEGFIGVLENFRDELVRLSEQAEASEIEEWKSNNNDIVFDFDLGVVLRNVYIDLVPLNSFFVDGKFVFFDQEFCLNVCPLNVLIFRMIVTLYSCDIRLGQFIPLDELLQHFGVYENREMWGRLEWNWLGALINRDELADYHRKKQKDYLCIGSNRQRMNYSQADYERLFINVFEHADTRKLILFGSGNFTKHFLMIYGRDYPVYAIVDNSQEKWGSTLEGIKICSPDILKELQPAEYKLIICIKNYLSVMKQLDEMGIGGYSIYDQGKSYPRPLKPIVKNGAADSETNGVKADKKKYHIGYVAGAFDMFHVGHLNLLRRAKEQCDYLIVGVISDETIERKKDKKPIIPEADRCDIVASCRYVDQAEVLPDKYNDITEAYKMFHFDVQFSGNDHADDPGWLREKAYLESQGADIVFFQYTEKVSSTKLREELKK